MSIEFCIVGEPTSSKVFGDTIKNGRRGSLSGKLKIFGIQGHIAYPELAKNPIHIAGNFIEIINKYKWDEGNEYFPPTSFQISSIYSDKVASNMIPSWVKIEFNLRFSNELTQKDIEKKFEELLTNNEIQYEIDWNCSAEPFVTEQGKLTGVFQKVIKNNLNIETNLSTSGGTSDARFISKHADETIEFGPLNATAHKVNENIKIEELEKLESIYYGILRELLL